MLTDHEVLLFGSLLLCLFLLHRTRRVRLDWQAFGNLPAYSVLVSPIDDLSRLLPRIPQVSAGRDWGWKNVYERVFATSKSDIVQVRSIIPYSTPHLLIADATAAKAIFLNRAAFPKVVRILKGGLEATYGPSIGMTEHDEWRKHQRIAAPSFTESNNALVWESTVEIILGYFIKWNRDGKGSIVTVPDLIEVTTQISYMVFSTAGFGVNVDWDWDNKEIPSGHTMSFLRALTTSAEGLILRAVVPRWLLSLTKSGREALSGYYELKEYMLEMIEDRKGSAVLEERKDLLSNLIRASIENDYSQRKDFDFTQSDLLGNIFVFLLAGYETTTSAMSFSVALLATHQEEQEELYKHVRSVVPDGRLPTYQDVPQLTRVLAVIYETLRLFPPANFVQKETAEDSVIPTDSGERLLVPKGTLLATMIHAIHHNPKYWPDPYEFRPSRFLGDYNQDAFIPFSAGTRGCLGRRFAEIEQIATLSVIILHYRITVLDEPRYAHETTEERKERVLTPQMRFVLKPVRTPVVFTPREGANVLAY